MAKMKKPDSGGTPKRITTKNPPGGPHTPGAKQTEFERLAIKDAESKKIGRGN